MFISNLCIEGYKNSKEISTVSLNKGLNVLVGENGSGKTTIINALRLIFKENEFSYMNISEDDFYKSIDDPFTSDTIKIDLTLDELTADEEVTFLSWCDADFKAQLHLEVHSNPNRKGYYKKEIWGGNSKSSIFEDETYECIDCIYLPPLRDAEEKLTNGRKSRLAQLLKKQYGDHKDVLVSSVKKFNQQITMNTDGNYNEITDAKKNINTKLIEAMGTRMGQSVNLQFADTTFNKIVESIRMVFFPYINEKDPEKFRDIATNSLGYNNLLYVATVFAELELLKDNNLITVLLIEEPEAHLHPQLQIKLIKYLEQLSHTLVNTQIILTTHSPVLASSINIDNIIHISENDKRINATSLRKVKLGESKNYLNRWLDVTKSTLLFSKGIILVEGISEAMLIPSLAKVVLAKYNLKAADTEHSLPNSLEEAGISVININGVNFNHFMKLFSDCDEQTEGEKIPIYCSGITDNDPPDIVEIIKDEAGNPRTNENGKDETSSHEVFPTHGNPIIGANPALLLKSEINKSKWGRLFSSPLKTFEYDLAMEKNTLLMAQVIKDLWPSKTIVGVKKACDSIIEKNNEYIDEMILSQDSKFILQHIDNKKVGKGLFAQELSQKIEDLIIEEDKKLLQDKSNIDSVLDSISKIVNVPTYINKAIIWACCGGEPDD